VSACGKAESCDACISSPPSRNFAEPNPGQKPTAFKLRHLVVVGAQPRQVEPPVLVDSAGLAWLRPIPELNSSMAATRTLIESVFYDKKMVSDGAVLSVFTDRMRNNDGYTIQRTVAGFATPRFEDAKLASIHVPTLVMWGRQDELIPLASGEKLRDGIRGAKQVVFEECGHVPQIEKSTEFNRALLEFLGK
jgi:pimeloyl-ACP methyl ester carboxylesterase